MKAVIIGASGLVGGELLKALLSDSFFTEVISVGRKRLSIDNPKLIQIEFSSIDQLSSHHDQLVGDIYFCCLGTTIKLARSQENFRLVDQVAVVEFAKIAKSHQAKSLLIVSAEGAHAHSKIFYNKVKGEMENEVKSLGLSSVVFMHPCLLIGDRAEQRTAESAFIKIYNLINPVLPNKLSKYAGTKVEHLVSKMIELSKMSSLGVQTIGATEI